MWYITVYTLISAEAIFGQDEYRNLFSHDGVCLYVRVCECHQHCNRFIFRNKCMSFDIWYACVPY